MRFFILLTLLLPFAASAQSCQGIWLIQHGLQDAIRDDPSWPMVNFQLWRDRLGTDCEMDVRLGGPGGLPPPGFFEGVEQITLQGHNRMPVTRELAIVPQLGKGDRADIYELSLDSGGGTRQELRVSVVGDSIDAGTIYVLLLQFDAISPEPKVQVLLEASYNRARSLVPCLSRMAPACLAVAWAGGNRTPRIDVLLAAADGSTIHKGFEVVSDPPQMRIGFLGGEHQSQLPDPSVHLMHKVCSANGNTLTGACSMKH